MKVIIEHDSSGNIQSVVVPVGAATGPRTVLRPQSGNVVAEIEVPQVRNEKDFEHLREIKRLHIVSGSGKHARLVRKP
jgi:hypothetical protein